MLIFLVHVRDPQFYALPAKTRAKNGNVRIMGFPPIGIMSLSSVVKRALRGSAVRLRSVSKKITSQAFQYQNDIRTFCRRT